MTPISVQLATDVAACDPKQTFSFDLVPRSVQMSSDNFVRLHQDRLRHIDAQVFRGPEIDN
jgi:hypothetical protein